MFLCPALAQATDMTSITLLKSSVPAPGTETIDATRYQGSDPEKPEDLLNKYDPWAGNQSLSPCRDSQRIPTKNKTSFTLGIKTQRVSSRHIAAMPTIIEDITEGQGEIANEEVETNEEKPENTSGEEKSVIKLPSTESRELNRDFSFMWQDSDTEDEGEGDIDISSWGLGNYENETSLEEEIQESSLVRNTSQIKKHGVTWPPSGTFLSTSGIWQDDIFSWHTQRIWGEETYKPPRKMWFSIAPLEHGEGLTIKRGKVKLIDKLRYGRLGLRISQAEITEGEHQALKEPSIRRYRCQPSPLRLCFTAISEDE